MPNMTHFDTDFNQRRSMFKYFFGGVVTIILGIWAVMAFMFYQAYTNINPSATMANPSISWGYNGVVESRCINNMLHTIDASGIAHQTFDENNRAMRCN